MEYNRHTENNNVFNGVFINNQFVNYHNIPQNRRRELLIASGGGFRPETSFVKDNTRDDGLKTAIIGRKLDRGGLSLNASNMGIINFTNTL